MIIEIAKFIVLLIVTYFFMQILTDKNKKLSIVGTILVCFSSFVFYNAVPYSIIIGELAVICVNEFIVSKKKYLKIIALIILCLCVSLYTSFDNSTIDIFKYMMLFTYLALFIWIILDKKPSVQFSKLDKVVLSLFIIISFIMSFGISYLSTDIEQINTPDENNNLTYLFSYGYSMFLPFKDLGENALYSSFLSLFPLSLIMAMIYLYNNEKEVNFFMPMIIVIVFQSIFCMTKASLFKYIGWDNVCNYGFASGAVGLSSIYLYMYMLEHIDKNIFKLKTSIKVVLGLLVFYFLIPRSQAFMGKGYMYILAMLVTLLYFLFVNFGDKRYKKVLLVVLVIWSLISALPVLFV